MVQGVLDALRKLGIKHNKIKTDYFSGLAS